MRKEDYLLDTNVVSELRKGSKCNDRVTVWFEAIAAPSLFLSVITLAEIQHGIELISRRDKKQATQLKLWKSELENNYRDLKHLLNIEADTAQQWGKLQAIRPIPVMDAWLAATAIIHNLTIVTRNEGDFDDLPVKILNPWQ